MINVNPKNNPIYYSAILGKQESGYFVSWVSHFNKWVSIMFLIKFINWFRAKLVGHNLNVDSDFNKTRKSQQINCYTF